MGMNPEFIRFPIAVRFGRGVDDDGLFRRNALKAVMDEGRDMDEDWVVRPRKEFVDLAAGRGALPAVIQDDLHHPPDDRHVVGLPFVVVPPLDHPRIGGRHIDLAKTLEHFVVGAQHLHQLAPLVGNNLQFLDHHPVDHRFPPVFLKAKV